MRSELKLAKLLHDLEQAIRNRSPILADRLQPGLSEERIRRMLTQARIQSKIEPIVTLYSWKNGTNIDPSMTQIQASPFPSSIYMFMELEMMIVHFQGFTEGAIYHPEMAELVGRYFPVFWDGSTGYIAIDLKAQGGGRVVLVEPEWQQPVRQAYRGFTDFLIDAIRANQANEPLTCFAKVAGAWGSEPNGT